MTGNERHDIQTTANRFGARAGAILLALSLAVSALTPVLAPRLEWRFEAPTFRFEDREEVARFETVLDYRYPDGEAHSPAVSVLENGFRVMWFQGSREAARDVRIVAQDFGRRGEPVGNVRDLLSAGSAQRATQPAQTVWVLGNTIQFDRDDDLLATTVSLGGWSFANISHADFADGAEARALTHLSLSPILNRSYLVRSPTFRFKDGSIALPAYMELERAISELVRLSPEGRVIGRRRISSGNLAIQPDIAVFSETEAVALMRNFNGTGQVVASWTEDGGNSWSPPELLDLPNIDAPVAALAIDPDSVLLAYNPSPEHANSLALGVSTDRGRSWKQISVLEDEGTGPGKQVRYPVLRRLANGSIILAYSHSGKGGIRVHVFNEAWVRAQ